MSDEIGHFENCLAIDDEDFDGQSYRPDWRGTNPNPFIDRLLHPTPMRFTTATTDNGRVNYSTTAFENDLPAIESEDAQSNPPFCDQDTGANCVNPPHGAQFYPFYTTGLQDGGCVWQQGGNYIPGTINHFGGSSTAEYGGLLRVLFPEPGFTTSRPIEDFNSGDMRNPCRPSGLEAGTTDVTQGGASAPPLRGRAFPVALLQLGRLAVVELTAVADELEQQFELVERVVLVQAL